MVRIGVRVWHVHRVLLVDPGAVQAAMPQPGYQQLLPALVSAACAAAAAAAADVMKKRIVDRQIVTQGQHVSSAGSSEHVYVNPKQLHAILRRRAARAKAEAENRVVRVRRVRPELISNAFLSVDFRPACCPAELAGTPLT